MFCGNWIRRGGLGIGGPSVGATRQEASKVFDDKNKMKAVLPQLELTMP